MDNKALFIRTSKGEDEARGKTALLAGDIRRALVMVDGTATFGEISKRAAPSLRGVLDEMFKELEKGGFIQDKAKAGNIPRIVVPPKMSVPAKKLAEEAGEELDFTAAFRPPSPEAMAAEAAKAKAEADAKAKQEIEAAKLKKAQQEAETAKLKAQQEAEAARLKAEQEAAKAREEAELAKQRAAAEAKAREEAEQRAKKEAEAARIKAEQEAARVRAELEAAKAKAEAKAKEEAERRAREEAEAARLKAQQEAEAARLKAEQEAAKAREEAELAKQRAAAEAKAREEAEQRAKKEAEAARIKAEQEAARERAELEAAKAEAKAREEAERRARDEAEAARLKAQQEAEAKAKEEAERRAREEAEAARLKAQQEAEAARLKAEQEAAKAREEAERAKQKADAEARVREEAEQHDKEKAEGMLPKPAQDAAQAGVLAEAAKRKSGAGATARSTSATVLFFDVVGYTKQPVNKQIKVKKQFNQLLSDCLEALEDSDHIILDTGDGAAIGFLQHPEDALEVAMQFRKMMVANEHQDYPDLKVRTGIHLGPINVVQDMNGQNNMVGDGINDAQRVMSFAGTDQIYISRPYHDFVSRLSDEYADLFQYRGSQQDKHGREHQVYEVVDALAPVAEVILAQTSEPALAMKLEPFSFAAPEAAAPPVFAVPDKELEPEQQQDQDVAARLLSDIGQLNRPEEAGKPADAGPAAQPPPSSAVAAAEKPPKEAPKEAPKPAAEARMPSEEDVRKLAETQAKAWAEAEQRAAAAAAKRAAQPQQEEVPHIAQDKQAVRVRRKPIPWGKAGAGLFVLLLIALFAVPYLLPTKDYATEIERLLTARLQQPVHIGQLTGRLLPAPRLELSNISVGEAKQIQIQRAQADFTFSALFSSSRPIDNLELVGMQVNGTDLTQISAWLQKIAADTQYPIAHVKLDQAKLEADGVQLSGIVGEISFNQTGKFAQAKLHAEGNKFALDINATPENKMQVSIEVRGSALPLLPNWVFDELSAKGELTNNELVISDLDGRIMGGILLGDARIAWRSGWQAQGKLVAKTITMQNMGKALSGDMDGTARFRMQATSLSKLVEKAVLNGTFVVKKGTINGVDIVETARLRSKENLPGGRTHFDELSGDLSVAEGIYAFRQLKMNAGVLTATGALDIAKQELSGRILADLSMRAGMGSVELQVGGLTDHPSLRAVR